MWVLTWKRYQLSKLATFVSATGALIRYGGVTCLFSELIPAAIVCIIIGIAFHFWAEQISFNAWKKNLQTEGYEVQVIQGNLQLAVQLYNGNPCEKTLKYFETINPQIAAQIRTMVANNKQSK